MNDKIQKINIFPLVMIVAAFAISIKYLPMIAETGLFMIFFILVAAVTFLIPSALVSAELATGWPEKGGIYVWIKEAFGNSFGFTSVWLQWMQMIFGTVTVLMFISSAFAFVISPALVNSRVYMILMIIGIYWIFTLLNMRGMKTSSYISSVCVLVGVFIPGALIIILGTLYVLLGLPIHLNFTLSFNNFIPSFSDIKNIVLLTGFIFVFMGIEVSAGHANDIKNPKRNYPIAIFLVVFLLLFMNVMGSMAVGIVIPHNQISLVSGIFDAFAIFFSKFHIGWMTQIVAVMVAFGAIGQISTWILGPVKGLSATADSKDLPSFLQKVNSRGIPVPLLIIQASLISLFAFMIMFIPKINSVFWILLDMAALLYLLMYMMLFAAAIKLRYKKPEIHRAYKVPGGKFGIWVVSGIGFLICVFAFTIGFFPPNQLSVSNVTFYECFLIIGTIIITAIPFVIAIG